MATSSETFLMTLTDLAALFLTHDSLGVKMPSSSDCSLQCTRFAAL
jgi:hypothetical protein